MLFANSISGLTLYLDTMRETRSSPGSECFSTTSDLWRLCEPGQYHWPQLREVGNSWILSWKFLPSLPTQTSHVHLSAYKSSSSVILEKHRFQVLWQMWKSECCISKTSNEAISSSFLKCRHIQCTLVSLVFVLFQHLSLEMLMFLCYKLMKLAEYLNMNSLSIKITCQYLFF